MYNILVYTHYTLTKTNVAARGAHADSSRFRLQAAPPGHTRTTRRERAETPSEVAAPCSSQAPRTKAARFAPARRWLLSAGAISTWKLPPRVGVISATQFSAKGRFQASGGSAPLAVVARPRSSSSSGTSSSSSNSCSNSGNGNNSKQM